MTDGEALSKGDLWEEYYTNLHRAYNAMRRTFQKSGLTQDQIAKRLSVDKALISKRLNGSENLTLKTLSFMGSAMGCRLTIDYTPYDEVEAAEVSPFLGVPTETATVSSTAGVASIGLSPQPLRKAA